MYHNPYIPSHSTPRFRCRLFADAPRWHKGLVRQVCVHRSKCQVLRLLENMFELDQLDHLDHFWMGVNMFFFRQEPQQPLVQVKIRMKVIIRNILLATKENEGTFPTCWWLSQHEPPARTHRQALLRSLAYPVTQDWYVPVMMEKKRSNQAGSVANISTCIYQVLPLLTRLATFGCSFCGFTAEVRWSM